MPDYTLIPHDSVREELIVVQPASVPHRKPYAMAYVQPQCWEAVMCAEDALGNGTAFRSLVMPFMGKEAGK